MKNKLILLSITLSFAMAREVKAQVKPLDFSLQVYGGYGLLTPGGDFMDYTTSTTFSNTNSSGGFKTNKYGLGQGIHIGAGLSFKLNGTISIGLDADYLTGSKTVHLNEFSDTANVTSKSHHSVFSFIPNMSFKLCSHPGYDIYNTIGIVAALKTNFEIDNFSQSGTSTNNDDFIYKYGFNLGFQDAFGIRFHISKTIQAFAQVTGYYLQADPQSYYENAISSTNGTAKSIVQFNVTFSNRLHEGYTSTSQLNGITETAAQTVVPISQRIYSIGLNAGLIINLKK